MVDFSRAMNDWAEVQKSGTSMTFHQFWEAYKSPDFDLNTMITPPSDTTPKGNTRTRPYKTTTNKRSRKNTPAYLTGEEDPFDQTDTEFWGDDLPTTTTETPNPVIRDKNKTIKRTIKGDFNNTTDENGNPIDLDQIASPEELHQSPAQESLPRPSAKSKTLPTNDISASSGNVDPSNESNGLVVYPEAGQHKAVPEFDFQAELDSTTHTSQMEALYHLLHGDNVILSGQAGAGKSWVIETFRTIVDDLINPNLQAENGSTLEVAYTASTGVAATIIKGRTIHSWSGLGIDVDPFSLESLPESKKWWMINNVFEQIRKTDCLIIDEVSMLPAYYLENLDREFKIARGNNEPFGGMQVVLVGDFLQLPPVDKHEIDSNGNRVNSGYCFTARNDDGRTIFGTSHFKWCYLDKTRRSKDDKLNDLLNGIRQGHISWESLENLRSRYEQDPDWSKTYTELKTVNRSVDSFNNQKLDELPGRAKYYRWEMDGDEKKCEELRKTLNLHDVKLKPGAIVMLTSNQASGDPMLVNGSMGEVVSCLEDSVVIRFNDGQDHWIPMLTEKIMEKNNRMVWDQDLGKFRPVIREDVVARVTYLPVKLAWAVTVHKSQGQTLDGAVIDLSKCFTKGLGYVALSRCRSLDDIIMKGSWKVLPQNALLVNDAAREADMKILDKSASLHVSVIENEERSSRLLEIARLLESDDGSAQLLEDKVMDSAPISVALADDLSVYRFVRDHRLWKRAWGMNVQASREGLDDHIDEWVKSPRLDAEAIALLESLRSQSSSETSNDNETDTTGHDAGNDTFDGDLPDVAGDNVADPNDGLSMSNKISELESTVESLNGMIKSLREEIESLRRANGVLRDEILSHGGDSMALVRVDDSSTVDLVSTSLEK